MRYIVPTLFFCFISFSQSKDSICNNNNNNNNAKNIFSFNIKLDSLSKIKPNINYNFRVNNNTLFSVYNQNTKLNDYLYVSKDSIYFAKSVNYNSHQLIKKDSFNPHGASNIGVGLIMGSINTIFKGIFNN
jgi:hypothetical protein